MSEAEFDSYLSLLSKFLRLRSRQRAELADELRDHLEARLEELLAAGHTREQAVAVALEEFGDAAVLATEFSRLASRRTRRFVMRCTAASAAVVAAVVLLSLALAPPGPNGPGPGRIVAQQGPAPDSGFVPGGLPGMTRPGGMPAVADESSVEQEAVARLDERLRHVPAGSEFKFEEMPLREVLNAIADSIEADVLIDEAALADAGVTADEPVTFKVTRTRLSAQSVLDFVLGPKGLAFVNRAGVIYVTSREQADELLVTKVYNVRDLLEHATIQAATHPGMTPGGGGGGLGGGLGGGGFFSVRDAAAAATLVAGQIGGGREGAAEGMMPGMAGSGMESGGGGLGGGMGMTPPQLTGAASELVDTIRRVTPGPWFDIDGVGGTVTVFNGLLVIRQTEENHAETQKLLDALRAAGGQQPGGSVTVPKDEPTPDPAGGAPVGEGGLPGPPPGYEPTAGIPGTPAAPKGLGAKFADYHPTASMRQMFLGALGGHGVPAGEIGEVGMLQTLLGINGPARQVFLNAGIDSGQVQQVYQQSFAERSIGDLYAFLDAAQAEARKDGLGTIDTGHLLVVLLEKGKDGPLRELLAQMGINADQVRDWVEEYRKATPSEERNPLQTAPRRVGSSDAGGVPASEFDPLKAAVGLRVRIGDTEATGSGVLVASRPGKALLLTTANMVLDEKATASENAAASVEVTLVEGAGAAYPRLVSGKVVRADRAANLAVVEIDAAGSLPLARLAPRSEIPSSGDAVFSVGVTGGLPVRREQTSST